MNIHSCQYVKASEVLSQDHMDILSMSGDITWGDANLTLIAPHRIMEELGLNECDALYDKLGKLPTGTMIDLES